MADNVAVTAGSGTTISTEEVTTLNGSSVSARHVQRVGAAIVTGDGTAIDLPGDSSNGLDVDITRSALPSGAATSAKQDTIIGHVDGIEGLLTTIDADTGNISTKTDTIAGAVSGTEMQVDVLTMPTVTVNAHAVTNAGTFAVQVDGAALTSLQLADDVVATLGTTTYTETSTKGTVIGAVRRDADTTLVDTTNEIGPLQMNAAGQLKVEVFSGETLPVSLTSTTVTGTVAVTQSGTWDEVGINDSGNSITVDNGGTFAVQVDGSALTALQLIDDPVIADDAAFTPATSKVMVAGYEADESSTDSVDEGDAGAARMTLDRKQIVTIQPHTAGGLSVFNGTSSDGGTALTNSAQAISAAAGQVYGWYIYNPNATAQFVQFYNTAAASVTVGTTSPLFMLTIPATSAANVNFVQGITFSNTGFSCAATSTAGGNGAPSTALDAVIFYK